MGVTIEFENFEQQFLNIIGEFRSIVESEKRLRVELQAEVTKTESAEAGREAAKRTAAEARNAAAAAAAGAAQAAAQLSKVQNEISGLKLQLELAERQRKLFEERCIDISSQVASLEREIQQLRPLQLSHSNLQRQYVELQDRVRIASEEARSEVSRLENELRRVERCAAAGSEIRERARLAAAAHARERHFATAELQHTTRELLTANSEITRLGALVAELQLRLVESECNDIGNKAKTAAEYDAKSIAELKAALEAEKTGAARLEQALASALADNAMLAARLHAADNTPSSSQPARHTETTSTNICPIDDFLAD